MPNKIYKVACLADIHLRTRTFTRRVHFDGDAEYGLEQARLALEKLRPDMIILAGDILNSRTMEQPCGEMLRRFMESFSGTQVLAIHGNHDRADKLAIESYGAIDLGRYGIYQREPHTLRVN